MDSTPYPVPVQALLIDDDLRLAAMLVRYLGQHGVIVRHASTANAGLAALRRGDLDLIILDLMLPDGDGLTICREIRAESGLPIVMLTAKGDPTDRIVGLELGADDYLPKPFEPRELLARLRAVLRRGQAAATNDVLRFGRLEIDGSAREARVDGKRCDLTARQFDLLRVLAERAGRVVSRDSLQRAVTGDEAEAFDRSIDVHIGKIRAAIEDDAKTPRRLITVRGAGYLFARRQD
jgi:DNA-binding response OmpR family regulator